MHFDKSYVQKIGKWYNFDRYYNNFIYFIQKWKKGLVTLSRIILRKLYKGLNKFIVNIS